ncbi:MAG: hypothetical protein V2I76_10555, partial [Roseobacter sp.]|nr:hypothetical protein [Roseobacter sp.]
ADPRIVSSGLGLRASDGALVLIVVAAAPVELAEIESHLADLPSYACPSAVILTDPSEPGLLFPVGTPNRTVAAEIINSRPAVPLAVPAKRIAS